MAPKNAGARLAGFLCDRWLSLALLSLACLTAWLIISARLRNERPGVLIPKESLLVGLSGKDSPLEGGNSNRADAQFVLINKGSKPVRIVALESGCGCAQPVARPEVIAGGGQGVIDVAALTIPAGQKDVPITVHTDSPIQPKMVLTLRIIGTRQPPFLHLAQGDLTFKGKVSRGDWREIKVISVQRQDQDERPIITSDLPFLSFEETSVQDSPTEKEGIVYRDRKYRAEVAEIPPSGTTVGRVVIKDPWGQNTEPLTLNVLVEPESSGLKAAPSFLTLGGPHGRKVNFIVIADSEILALEVDSGNTGDAMIQVEQEPADKPKRVHKLNVKLVKNPASDAKLSPLIIRVKGSANVLKIPLILISNSSTAPAPKTESP